jgi:hypothetical protein
MFAIIKDGLRTAGKHPKLVLLIWAWYGLLALIPTLPAWAWWNAALGASPEAATVLKRFGIGVFLDLTRGAGVSGMGLLMSVTVAVAMVALVSSAFVFGGILEVLGSDDDRRSFMHRFYRGGGHFFWRFVRLALVAGVCLVLATGVVSAAIVGMTSPLTNSEWEPAGYLVGIGNILALVIVGALFLLALDYARIRVARDGGRSMFKAYFRALGFVLRHLLTTYGIATPIVAMLAALMVCYLAYETNAPAASTWGAIATLFLIQQAVALGRVFLRVALAGAERHYDLTMRPALVPAPAAAFVPAVAVATSPAEEPPPSADSVAPTAAEVHALEPPRALTPTPLVWK